VFNYIFLSSCHTWSGPLFCFIYPLIFPTSRQVPPKMILGTFKECRTWCTYFEIRVQNCGVWTYPSWSLHLPGSQERPLALALSPAVVVSVSIVHLSSGAYSPSRKELEPVWTLTVLRSYESENVSRARPPTQCCYYYFPRFRCRSGGFVIYFHEKLPKNTKETFPLCVATERESLTLLYRLTIWHHKYIQVGTSSSMLCTSIVRQYGTSTIWSILR